MPEAPRYPTLLPRREPLAKQQLPELKDVLDRFCKKVVDEIDVDSLLQEKLMREWRKRTVSAKAEPIDNNTEENDETLERVQREMKETGIDIRSQQEVRASVGQEQVEWTAALEAELNSLKHMGSTFQLAAPT